MPLNALPMKASNSRNIQAELTATEAMMNTDKSKNKTGEKPPASDTSQDACRKAPEWAEHQRLEDDDMPCDDGRSGNIERERKDKANDKAK
jgi:hypothetical protein